MTKPMIADSATVQPRPACGSARVNGSAPRIETQITALRPIRSPTGPPMKVPAATAPRKTKSRSCEVCTETPKRSIRKKV